MRPTEIRNIIQDQGIRPDNLTRGELIRVVLQKMGTVGCLQTGGASLCGWYNCLRYSKYE